MTLARVGGTFAVLVLLLRTDGVAQAPRVLVRFRLADSVYVQAFTKAERSQLEDSATAMLVQLFTRHLGFLSFTRDPADSTRVLMVMLDQREPGSGSQIGERGFHLFLVSPPVVLGRSYWRFRTMGLSARDTVGSVATFLGELANVLDNLDRTAWEKLVGDVFSRLSIADTAAAAWSPPGAASGVEWLIPLWPDSACFDPDGSTLRIRNEVFETGGTETVMATAKPNGKLTVSPSFVVPTAYERFRGRIRARIDPPNAVFPAPPSPDSILVKAVFVTAYLFDESRCAAPAPISGGP